ncbi:olfactory receptor 52Z1 [Xenopus tropicalis]|uniref:Olfactory receptor n=1 Tax=Xenopus tropicalis TaxID=8364 RepID=A0A8J0QTV6_XENTR|nr:olfactory receptor 52Z1 [Xenopus tropicalis]
MLLPLFMVPEALTELAQDPIASILGIEAQADLSNPSHTFCPGHKCQSRTDTDLTKPIKPNMEPGISNQSFIFSYTDFTLLGFPGISRWRPLLAIPFFSIYLVILSGNSLLICLICIKKTLHSPMYFLISLLFAINITSITTTLPKFLLDLLFHLNQVSLTGCLLQMFVIYFVTACESTVLLLMSSDRYVAICRPLRYHNIMTTSFLAWLTVIVIIRNCLLICPLIVLISMVQFCRSNVILNFACENMALLSLGCGDTTKPQIAGLIVRIIATVLDGSLLLISYSTILYTAMKTATGKSRHKALNTCGTHLLVAMVVYLCALASTIVQRMETSISTDIKNLFIALYLIIPALLNPFIYGFRVSEIRKSLLGYWRERKNVFSSS